VAEASGAADPFLGRTVAGRFEVVSVLGEGGMGKVYTAKDRETGQLAALKVVIGKLSGNDEYVQRLKQEARTAGRLRHDAAVRILAHGETESGEPYLAMEYCPGRNLKELLQKEGHLDIPRACNIVAQMLGAVGAAHKQGIIHRDLKPENIKVAPDPLRGEGVKVLDFGVAKFIGGEGVPEMENAVKTKTGIILGTPKYMAPEQIRGEQVDGRSDIYSCGAILYELIAGSPPFIADDVFGYVTKHLKEPVIPLAERVPEYGVPKELDDLVLWMLEKNPQQRPKDAIQVVTALEKFAKGSSSARAKFAARVLGSWLVPGVAAAAAIGVLVPESVPVQVEFLDAGATKTEATSYSLHMIRNHGMVASAGLAVAAAFGVFSQPRMSVAAYLRRLALVFGVVVLSQAVVAFALGGAGWAAAGFSFTAILIFVAFSLAWPMENRMMRLVLVMAASAVAAAFNPVPLKDLGEAVKDQPEFFRRVWHPDLWQQGASFQSPGFAAVAAVVAMGLAFGVGSLFLPKPGRGSSG
jgi:hypothetical protein